MPWDWGLVGSETAGIAAGIAIGGWIATALFRMAIWQLLSHPTIRKVANAADKVTGGGGFLGGLVSRFFGGAK